MCTSIGQVTAKKIHRALVNVLEVSEPERTKELRVKKTSMLYFFQADM
jgi:hypothetical protein